ncbi:hypothetical protein [Pontibacter liquoris]|uniref:hypothetical protein n=1 Tax=Pontibacter liquoris TaxID=2905677 RepID=UPI001FA6D167|nr:hypothetical protein [Pontibacter liquoris]
MLEIIRSLLIGLCAIAVLLPVVRFALRRLSPAGQEAALSPSELKYIQRQEWRLMIAYLVFACVLSVVAAGMLAIISSIINASNVHMYVLTPNFRALFAPGLLLGLTLAMLPLRLVQRALLGHDYELYKTYMQHQEGHNSLKVYRLIFGLMLALSVALGWTSMRWHVAINQDKIRITNFLLNDRTYAMEDISSIQSLGEEGEYLIRFNDAYILNTAYLKPVQPETIALLSQKSGKHVIH